MQVGVGCLLSNTIEHLDRLCQFLKSVGRIGTTFKGELQVYYKLRGDVQGALWVVRHLASEDRVRAAAKSEGN